jgi:hypothetical protein
VTKLVYLNLVTPKVGAKNKLSFSKSISDELSRKEELRKGESRGEFVEHLSLT